MEPKDFPGEFTGEYLEKSMSGLVKPKSAKYRCMSVLAFRWVLFFSG